MVLNLETFQPPPKTGNILVDRYNYELWRLVSAHLVNFGNPHQVNWEQTKTDPADTAKNIMIEHIATYHQTP